MNLYLSVLWLGWTLVAALIPSRHVYIYGASGILGKELAKTLPIRIPNAELWLGCRDLQKASLLKQELESFKNINLFQVSFDQSVDWSDNKLSLTHSPLAGASYQSKLSIIHAGGVMRYGNSHKSLQEQLTVNTIFPLLSGLQWLQCYPTLSVDLINISSGDGESVYINSDIVQTVEAIDDLSHLLSFIRSLASDPHYRSVELAHGDTPGYSLSKYLLNKGTRILHSMRSHKQRVISICPGNFQSPMTKPAELSSCQPIDQVVNHILDVLLDDSKTSGEFYREGGVIPW